MRYFLDCEFNGYRGDLISLALVRDDGRELYLVASPLPPVNSWVAANVVPILFPPVTFGKNTMVGEASPRLFPEMIEEFLRGDPLPTIIADWPDDIRYLCECLITSPGAMIDIPSERDAAPYNRAIQFVVERVDAYPTDLPGAVQHNALWDARALRRKLMPPKWRYQRKEGWGDIWRETEQDPNAAGVFETPGDWTVERV